MRFLKKKIALKQEKIEDGVEPKDANSDLIVKKEEADESSPYVKVSHDLVLKEDILPLRGPRKNRTLPTADSKNIVKNYGKALCAFASSKLAIPYIENVVSKKGYDGVNINKFTNEIKSKKETTNSMESLRRLLMEEDGDTEEEKQYKHVFKEISIIFMKYFSVNWIYSGKLVHKNAHLKFRFKMLRRVKNPEHFTYLKTSAKSS